MPTGGYNNAEDQSGVDTKYVPSPGGLRTNHSMRHSQQRDNKATSRCMQLLELPVCLRQAQ